MTMNRTTSSSTTKVRYSISSSPSKWELSCKPWLDEDGTLYQTQGVSTPPLKDFYMLWVTPTQVGANVWEIKSPFHNAASSKGAVNFTVDYAGFKTDSNIRGAIQSRSNGMLEFIEALLTGHINYLDRMHRNIQVKIISYLDVKSVKVMAQVSPHYKKLCYSDDIWQGLFLRSNLKNYITPGLLDLAKTQGWRLFYIMALRIAKSTTMPSTKQSSTKRMSIF